MYARTSVPDHEAARAWYVDLFGADPTFVASETEAVWELAEHRSIVIEQNAEHAGHAVHTFFVDDLDGLVPGSPSEGPAEGAV